MHCTRTTRVSLLTIAVICFAGCTNRPAQPSAGSPGSPGSADLPFAAQRLNVFNWSDYIDPDLIPEFERRTGATVQYDNYSSESELETKLLAGGSGYDVIFPSDRSMAPLVTKGLLDEVDKSLLPNWINLDPKFLGAPYDPDNRYSVPYFWGTVAVGIRTDHVAQPVKGFEVLFDERYKGRITMLDDAENVVATVLLHLGYPMNSTDDAHLSEVKKLLVQQHPLVQSYTSDAFKEKLIKDEAWVVLGWSGDILQAAEENENIRAIVPESGTMIWVDAMAIPKDAKNKRLAHAFINFLLDAEIAGRNANFVHYASPNMAARAHMDNDLLEDEAVYPPQEVLDRCQWLKDKGADIRKIERVWQEVRK
jgi:spermidine/putrescine-binding protein